MRLDDFDLYLSEWIKTKLLMRQITIEEVEEAFNYCNGVYIKEVRSQHVTIPPTYWFISETSEGRTLKICFIPIYEKKNLILKSAYEPEEWEIRDYESYY